jgi:predicted glycogen debranching enzyme
MSPAWGREICGDLAVAESREWLCTNGIGGFASGTVPGVLTRYHGLLVAALKPPLGRTLLVAKLDEQVKFAGLTRPLFANRWADGTVDPAGHADLEEFRLDGTTPVWTYACADALLEKRIFMEPGANTTHVRYQLLRASRPVDLEIKVLVNYRDYHATTRGDGWQMRTEAVAHGLRVVAFDGAQPFAVLAEGAEARPAHTWYHGFRLAAEEARGLDAYEDHLHAGTIRLHLEPDAARTVVLSSEPAPSLDGEAAWARRQQYEANLLARWERTEPEATPAPAWIRQLVLRADQFVVRRPLPDDPDGISLIAGYHWFGDWGRDTMISLPGLVIATGRPEIGRRILSTFALTSALRPHGSRSGTPAPDRPHTAASPR